MTIFLALGRQALSIRIGPWDAIVFWNCKFLCSEADLFMSKSKFRKTFANLNLFNAGNINKNEEPIEERLKSEQFSLLKVKWVITLTISIYVRNVNIDLVSLVDCSTWLPLQTNMPRIWSFAETTCRRYSERLLKFVSFWLHLHRLAS